MDNQEEELEMPKKPEEAITVETQKGGYAMISSKRKRRVGTDPLFENWQHEADREMGDNDPHKNR
jgi:hypothetical protein